MLSCRAADADAGASGIAATVGAATHTLPPRSTHCPFALQSLRPLYPFRKAASLAVGATHTPLTALHNACNPPHPPIPATHRPTDQPTTIRPPPAALRRLVLYPTILSCHAASSTLFHWLRHTAHTQAHIHIYVYLSAFPRTHVYPAYQVTRTYLLFPVVASPLLLSRFLFRFCSLFLSRFPLRLLASLGLFNIPHLYLPLTLFLALTWSLRLSLSLALCHMLRSLAHANLGPTDLGTAPRISSRSLRRRQMLFGNAAQSDIPLTACLPACLPAGSHFRETTHTPDEPSGKS